MTCSQLLGCTGMRDLCYKHLLWLRLARKRLKSPLLVPQLTWKEADGHVMKGETSRTGAWWKAPLAHRPHLLSLQHIMPTCSLLKGLCTLIKEGRQDPVIFKVVTKSPHFDLEAGFCKC